MTESEWTRDICAGIRLCNGIVQAIVGSKMQDPGWPDRFICHRYWRGHIEFKGAKTRLTDKQRIIIRGLRERQPGSAYVVRYPDRIEDHEGELLATFDGTALGLLKTLQQITS